MKKLIQICSLLSLMVVFTAISAFSQTGFGSEVEIPFAFNVGDRSYEAGYYIVRLDKRINGGSTLSIQDTKTDAVQVVLLNVSGDTPGKEVKLVFDTVEGRKYLTKVHTPERAFALIKSKGERNAKAREAAKSESSSPSDGAN